MEYNNELLLEMLDIAIGAMVENELCTYCHHSICDSDNCVNGIFDGLKVQAETNLNF